MSPCHLLLGCPLDLFPLLGCHSVQRLVHLLSFILAIWPAHFCFCFSVYSMISIIFVLFLISEHGILSCSFRSNILLSIALWAVLSLFVICYVQISLYESLNTILSCHACQYLWLPTWCAIQFVWILKHHFVLPCLSILMLVNLMCNSIRMNPWTPFCLAMTVDTRACQLYVQFSLCESLNTILPCHACQC